MIKRFSIRKISKYTIILFIVFLFYMFPKKEEYTIEKSVMSDIKVDYHDIFLLDKNNYLSKTTIEVVSLNKDKLIDELIEIMTIDGKYQDKIPNGFRGILPIDTKLISKTLEDNTLTLNFNKNLLDTKQEELVIEAIIYTMTSINNIDNVKIMIEGNKLDKLPKTGKNLDDILNRNYGINKVYDIQNLKNITKVTIYYINKTNQDIIYYVPVTKYMNSKEEKIKIIIDELTSKISYESNLMSYLNYNTKLLDYSFNENEIDLNFNEYLFDNNHNKKVLEEVIYSISYSLEDTYNVSKINFYVNNKEIK